jgi:hypothetical protein
MKTSEPFTNRQFFLAILVLTAGSFIPVIGWLSAFFLIIGLITWMCLEPKGFLSIIWRTILGVVLVCSIWILSVYLPAPGTYEEKTQFLTVGEIGFVLSAFGLACSILKARKERALKWTME